MLFLSLKNLFKNSNIFEVGINQLGGNSYLLNEKEMQLGERETLRILLEFRRYADMVIIRCFGHDQLIKYANISEVPVINALTDFSHPCRCSRFNYYKRTFKRF